MSIAQTRQRISTIDWSFASRIEFWMESMWLGALGLIPLVFAYNSSLASYDEPKGYALHFFALALSVLLVTDATRKYFEARARGKNVESFDVIEWLRSDRANILLAAVGVFTFIYIISTVLSPMPYYSFWGVAPGSTGYNLYSFLSMMVVFLAIVTQVRSTAQIWRILYVVSTAGIIASIYGTAQHFGWDPIGVEENAQRVTASFGNPIYFGAYLVMSIPATVAIIAERRYQSNKALIGVLAVGLGLQIAAMWFTGSRGPLVGLGAAAVALVIVGAVFVPRRHAFFTAGVIFVSAVIAGVLILLPSDADPARSVQFSGELSALVDRQEGGVIRGGLTGRSEIWGDTLELATTWETLPPDNGVSRALKPVFGFGPDMYRFSAPLVSAPRTSLEVVDHAHNRFLHVLAEQGWAGLVAMLAVAATAVWLVLHAGRRMWVRRSEIPVTQRVLFLGVVAALAGTGIEQMAGVGRAADLLTSWVFIGLAIVLYRMAVFSGETTTRSQVAEPDVQEDSSVRRRRRGRGQAAVQQPGQGAAAASFGVGLVALIVAITTFVLVDTQVLRASRLAMDAFEIPDAADAYPQFEDARSLAPQVEEFTLFSSNLLYDSARRLVDADRREEAVEQGEEALRQLADYHQRNPLAFRTRLKLAETAALLLEIGAVEYQDDQLALYQELARQFPTSMAVQAVVANSYVAAEQYERAIEIADEVIANEPITGPSSHAWWVKANALERLDQIDEAIAAYEMAIEIEPETGFGIFSHLSHLDLAELYEELGDTERAEFHRTTAEALQEAEPEQ